MRRSGTQDCVLECVGALAAAEKAIKGRHPDVAQNFRCVTLSEGAKEATALDRKSVCESELWAVVAKANLRKMLRSGVRPASCDPRCPRSVPERESECESECDLDCGSDCGFGCYFDCDFDFDCEYDCEFDCEFDCDFDCEIGFDFECEFPFAPNLLITRSVVL